MAQISAFLRSIKGGFGHYCPGCDEIHVIWTDGQHNANWTFNGDVERPDFKPSIRVFHPAHLDEGVQVAEEPICHYFINNGQIVYCGDCQHHLNGQTIDLPPLPEKYSSENFSWGGDL